MLIKIKKTWKDLLDNKPQHQGLTRRDFLARGMATGAVAITIPKLAFGQSTVTCPPPARAAGAIAQLFAEGGPTMGARFIGDAQAAAMNSTMASNYGISGTIQKLGSNLNIDSTSPFGMTLLLGPPGYPNGTAGWQKNVLSKISGGGHLGPFNADDGAGVNTGLIGGVSPFKISSMGKDLRMNIGNTTASWATSLPNLGVSTLSPKGLEGTFSMTPAAKGLTNSNALTSTANAIQGLTQAMDPVFNMSRRKGAQQLLTAATCSFSGNSALASPTYGSTLFDPTNIKSLMSNVTVSSLSSQEQALIAAYYQSAVGVAGGVMLELNGRDYHGQSPAQVIAPADIEDARAIVMFLAACDAAQAPGAFIYLANGQAIANGTQSVTATINGASVTINAPVATGDAGGTYNAGLIIFYDPKGSPPQAQMTGNLNTTDGSVTMSTSVASSLNAVAGLYLSALKWIGGGNVPQSALGAMEAAGVTSVVSNIEVI